MRFSLQIAILNFNNIILTVYNEYVCHRVRANNVFVKHYKFYLNVLIKIH